MPNRILKETIRTSETVNELSEAEENFFYRLITACDDYGRMDARPAILLAALYPLRLATVSEAEIGRRLNALERAGLVFVYTIRRRPYLQVVTWDRHQQVRAKRSKFPAPDDEPQESAKTRYQVIADDSTCPRNPNPNPNRESESKHDQTAPNGAEKPEKPPKQSRQRQEPPEGFDLFWQAYPRKVGKAPAVDEYRRRIKAGADPPAILRGARNYAEECRLIGREAQYICHPTTFLHQQRYEDYQDPPDPADFAPQVRPRAGPRVSNAHAAIDEAVAKIERGESYFGN